MTAAMNHFAKSSFFDTLIQGSEYSSLLIMCWVFKIFKRMMHRTKNVKDLSKNLKVSMQPSRSALRKSCSENMQQSYRRTPMPKLQKLAKQSKATY